jgi:hypothetical protein
MPVGDDAPAIDEFTDDELRGMTQGCTEQSCLYHGAINRELAARKKVRR